MHIKGIKSISKHKEIKLDESLNPYEPYSTKNIIDNKLV